MGLCKRLKFKALGKQGNFLLLYFFFPVLNYILYLNVIYQINLQLYIFILNLYIKKITFLSYCAQFISAC